MARVIIITFLFHLHVLDLTAIEDLDSDLVASDDVLRYFNFAERSDAKGFTKLVVCWNGFNSIATKSIW